ncbi:hypothetical protein ACFL3O_01345 [Candidatus Neomarinimicrobiota bacterium]
MKNILILVSLPLLLSFLYCQDYSDPKLIDKELEKIKRELDYRQKQSELFKRSMDEIKYDVEKVDRNLNKSFEKNRMDSKRSARAKFQEKTNTGYFDRMSRARDGYTSQNFSKTRMERELDEERENLQRIDYKLKDVKREIERREFKQKHSAPWDNNAPWDNSLDGWQERENYKMQRKVNELRKNNAEGFEDIKNWWHNETQKLWDGSLNDDE